MGVYMELPCGNPAVDISHPDEILGMSKASG